MSSFLSDKRAYRTPSGLFMILVLLVVSLWGCDDDSPEPSNLAELRPLTGEESYLINVSNQQAFSILNQIEKIQENGNFAVSPISSGMAIGMLYNGASDKTRLDLHNRLDLASLDEVMINKTFYGLTHFLEQIDYRKELTLSSSIWFNYHTPLNELYRNKMMAYYQAEVEPVDLAKNPVKIINRLIANRTNGAIDGLFEQLETSKPIIMVNALQFRGSPALKLKQIRLEDSNSFLANGNISVLMDENAIFNHLNEDGFELVDLPYQNKQFRLTLLQPDSDLREWVKNLNLDQYQEWLFRSDTIKNKLILPAISFYNNIRLDPVMLDQDATFPNLFDNSKSGVSVSPDLFQKNLFYIGSSFADTEYNKPTFRINQNDVVIDGPFAFVLREVHTGLILMCGIYTFEEES